MELKNAAAVRQALEWYLGRCFGYLNGRINPQLPCVHYSCYWGDYPEKLEHHGVDMEMNAFARNGVIVFLMDRILEDILSFDHPAHSTERIDEDIDWNFPYVRGMLLVLCAHELSHIDQLAVDYGKDKLVSLRCEQANHSRTIKWLLAHQDELRQALGYYYLPDLSAYLYYGGQIIEGDEAMSCEDILENYNFSYRSMDYAMWLRQWFLDESNYMLDVEDFQKLMVKFSFEGQEKVFVVKEAGELRDVKDFYRMACLYGNLFCASHGTLEDDKAGGAVITIILQAADYDRELMTLLPMLQELFLAYFPEPSMKCCG